jgi:hypothetical protein
MVSPEPGKYTPMRKLSTWSQKWFKWLW